MSDREPLIRRLDDLGATAVRGTTAPSFDAHALRRGRRHGHRGRWLAGVAAAAAVLVGAALWAPWAGDAARVDTVATSPIGDVVWAPSTEGVSATLRQVLPADQWEEDHGVGWLLTRLPAHLAVSRVDGHVVAAYVTAAPATLPGEEAADPRANEIGGRPTIYQASYAGSWQLPQPGRRIGIDLGDGQVLMVGSATLPDDQLVEVAAQVTVDGDGLTMPGALIGEIDGEVFDAGTVTVWDAPQLADMVNGLFPTWIVTLQSQAQLEALVALGDPDPSSETWSPLEPVHSIPEAVLDPARTFEAHGVTARLMTLNAYSRMVVIPTDPPAVVIANDGGRYAAIDDDVLAEVARSLVRVPRGDLGGVLDDLPVESTTTTAFEGSTTTTR